jgi:photosystem I subunit 8
MTLMASAFLPSILVPLVGLVFPAVAMASMFLYIEKEQIN